jgi:hypothetical protein
MHGSYLTITSIELYPPTILDYTLIHANNCYLIGITRGSNDAIT